MTNDEIMDKIKDIMIDVFDVDDLSVTDETSAGDVKEWDSLSHIRFMITVEKTFGVKFKTEEIAELKNVGELVRLVQAKLSAKG